MEEKLFFDNGKGFKLCGILNNAGKGTDVPIVILCHGFTTHKNRPKYKRFSEEFEKRGIASFRFDFFSHGESEGNFEDITISEGANDILKAIELLRGEGYKNTGLLGVSFGGISAAIAASKTDKINALVLISPVSDYAQLRKKELGDCGIKEWKERGFIPHRNPKGEIGKIRYAFLEDAKKNVVYEIADKISIPTLIIHGDKDDIVPIEQSIKTSTLIKNCRMEIVEGCGHRYENPDDFEKMINMAVGFIKECVQ
ncbi:MAG: alpha/beta fold hydrolase [Candidatus Micrarchaeota archaeon]|nr:alpha/beta fold hydrolase [Candidatus Micrarchaeota archaeon]